MKRNPKIRKQNTNSKNIKKTKKERKLFSKTTLDQSSTTI